jgi:hypothetical protein
MIVHIDDWLTVTASVLVGHLMDDVGRNLLVLRLVFLDVLLTASLLFCYSDNPIVGGLFLLD